jgi:hypothetical protein
LQDIAYQSADLSVYDPPRVVLQGGPKGPTVSFSKACETKCADNGITKGISLQDIANAWGRACEHISKVLSFFERFVRTKQTTTRVQVWGSHSVLYRDVTTTFEYADMLALSQALTGIGVGPVSGTLTRMAFGVEVPNLEEGGAIIPANEKLFLNVVKILRRAKNQCTKGFKVDCLQSVGKDKRNKVPAATIMGFFDDEYKRTNIYLDEFFKGGITDIETTLIHETTHTGGSDDETPFVGLNANVLEREIPLISDRIK